ncbi:MAG: cobalamin-dependent protein [Microthrixaceae bacterium]
MKIVGERFGAARCSAAICAAETMKRRSPTRRSWRRSRATPAGSIVLATVKGDVHDIGKNLVDIILTNNGYTVHNMGIKVPITEMIEKALETKADAIGMSGLLVKSTLIMRDNLLSSRPRPHPGAARRRCAHRAYVERDLRENHSGRLFYGRTPSRAPHGPPDEDQGRG